MTDRWTLEEWIADQLEAAGVASPRADARLLLDTVEDRFGSLAGCPGGVLDAMVQRRAARVPLQVVLGRTTFRWVELEVVAGVFVPRPETEVVAGLAIDACAGVERPLVLEPCTGSGAVTCALLTEVPDVRVVATDRSTDAVELATRNVARVLAGEASPHDHRPRGDATASVLHGDLLAPVDPGLRGMVDVLVANPPYLPVSDLPTMEPEVAGHDPHAALFGGDDGHEVVDRLLGLAASWLRPGGTVVLEVDDRRADDARQVAQVAGLVDVGVERDLAGRDRAIVATTPR